LTLGFTKQVAWRQLGGRKPAAIGYPCHTRPSLLCLRSREWLFEGRGDHSARNMISALRGVPMGSMKLGSEDMRREPFRQAVSSDAQTATRQLWLNPWTATPIQGKRPATASGVQPLTVVIDVSILRGVLPRRLSAV
jgi:hypothetical protein